jgi:hypothetical protein
MREGSAALRRSWRWLGLASCLGLVLAAAGAKAEPKSPEKSQPAAASAGAAPAASTPSQNAAPAPAYQEEVELGGYEIRPLGAGAELEFSGALTNAAIRALDDTLARSPAVHVLQLTSEGGAGSALVLADKLRKRGITTYVPSFCASACTLVFLGGRERFVAPGARLGFHQAASYAAEPAGEVEKFNAAMGSWMIAKGVAPGFVETVINTPHAKMWQPDLATLRKAGVVTGVAVPGQFAAPSFGSGQAEAMDKTVLNSPIYAALRKADPRAYEATRSEMVQSLQETDSAFGSSYFARAFERAAAIASDPSLVEFTAVRVEEIDRLRAASGPLCMLVATGRPYPEIAVRQIMPDALVQRKILATAAVLESTVSAPQPAPTRERVQQAFTNLMISMRNTLHDDYQYLRNPTLNPSRTCYLYEEIYKQVLRSDPDDRSVLLRGLLGQLL